MKGRSFTDRDESSGPSVAIINETMARHRFPNEDPVGKRIRFDVKEYGLDHPVADEIYGLFRNGFLGRLIVRMVLLPGIFAGLAVVISCSGIAAVMALAVSQRTREIGIRMALGARGGSVVGMVLRQGLVLALAGTALGMAGAAALTRLLSTFLYGTSATDLATFAAVSLLFLLVAGVACFIPAHQVTSIDPLVALRQE